MNPLDRILRRTPKGAHGRSTLTGRYWTIWVGTCTNGHTEHIVGDVDQAPDARFCLSCVHERGPSSDITIIWYRATVQEAHAYLHRLEGPDYADRAGFEVLR